ncbi:MAG: GAF domain-containing protein [Chrysiogenetes bacterium]|nr:GAF domain-containing protein [Chrysiogenetes bacterium]
MDKDDKGDLAERDELHDRAEDFLNHFKKGAEFTQELLQENERLRYRLVQLEQENRSLQAVAPAGGVPPDTQRLVAEIERLQKEKEEILTRYKEVEAENKDFAERYVDIEEENNNLANLYISSYQLHSTLDFKEVLQIIVEIIINLIGAEMFAVLLLDEKTHALSAVAGEGVDLKAIPAVNLGQGVVGKSAETGENYFVETIPDDPGLNPADPLVCIPLKIKEQVIGVICIYKLLQQKRQFANVDYELFTLLAGHAATAVFSAKLYSDSERKLNTIQGFIDLLTK